MNGISLVGRRVLVTQAEDFMGPALCAAFAAAGAELIADRSAPRQPGSGRAVIESAAHIDALVLNLAIPAPSTPAHQVSDDEWEATFAALVHPMREMVAAVLPQMIERKAGKIVLIGSASALRGMARRSSYAAARGAQLAYMQSVALELAPQGIQFNAIAQNFVENPTYFPPAVQANPRFQDRLQREVPLGRLVGAEEDALFAAYLCSPAAACFVGQVFPVSGGWALK